MEMNERDLASVGYFVLEDATHAITQNVQTTEVRSVRFDRRSTFMARAVGHFFWH